MFKTLAQRLWPRKSSLQVVNNTILKTNGDSPFSVSNEEPSVLSGSQSSTSSYAYTAPPVLTLEHIYREEFYDLLFGICQTEQCEDELANYVAIQVEEVLKTPEVLFSSLPVLPASLNKIVAYLGTDDFDPDIVVKQLNNEPMIAAKVIKLANSSFYNRNGKDVTDLKAAFMKLGANGLSKGVIDGFVSQLTPQSNLYFQFYGKKIWQHCLNIGTITRALLEDSEDSAKAGQGYLTGLICSLGDIIVYQFLVEAFKHSHPDCSPDSWLFRQVITKNAKPLSHAIAEHWELPKEILTTLHRQTLLKSKQQLAILVDKDKVSCFIYEARVISKLMLALDEPGYDLNAEKQKALELVYSQQAIRYIETIAADTD